MGGMTLYEWALSKMDYDRDYTASDIAYLTRSSTNTVKWLLNKATLEGRVEITGETPHPYSRRMIRLYRIKSEDPKNGS